MRIASFSQALFALKVVQDERRAHTCIFGNLTQARARKTLLPEPGDRGITYSRTSGEII